MTADPESHHNSLRVFRLSFDVCRNQLYPAGIGTRKCANRHVYPVPSNMTLKNQTETASWTRPRIWRALVGWHVSQWKKSRRHAIVCLSVHYGAMPKIIIDGYTFSEYNPFVKSVTYIGRQWFTINTLTRHKTCFWRSGYNTANTQFFFIKSSFLHQRGATTTFNLVCSKDKCNI